MTVWSLTTGRQFYLTSLSQYAAILAYLKRVSEREGYQRAMDKAEPGIDWRKALTGEGPEIFAPYGEMLGKMGVDLEKMKG